VAPRQHQIFQGHLLPAGGSRRAGSGQGIARPYRCSTGRGGAVRRLQPDGPVVETTSTENVGTMLTPLGTFQVERSSEVCGRIGGTAAKDSAAGNLPDRNEFRYRGSTAFDCPRLIDPEVDRSPKLDRTQPTLDTLSHNMTIIVQRSILPVIKLREEQRRFFHVRTQLPSGRRWPRHLHPCSPYSDPEGSL
jgi:hypothetical protein